MSVGALVKKHVNPLSVLAAVFVSLSVYAIAFPGPEGWGLLAGPGLLVLFGIPTIATNTIVIRATKAGKGRFIIQLICSLIIVLIIALLWIR